MSVAVEITSVASEPKFGRGGTLEKDRVVDSAHHGNTSLYAGLHGGGSRTKSAGGTGSSSGCDSGQPRRQPRRSLIPTSTKRLKRCGMPSIIWKPQSMISTAIASRRSSIWIRRSTKRRSANRKLVRESQKAERQRRQDAAFFISDTGDPDDRCTPVRRILLGTEGVADGSTDSQHIVGVKFDVIHDVVEVSLGADKEVSPHACSERRHQGATGR